MATARCRARSVNRETPPAPIRTNLTMQTASVTDEADLSFP
jgi:hypothetical protein